ncbi:AMP-binding protein [Sphingomonas gilva]|uniref:AMP-binding protein n=1 Tax=Sphingomonas gilva TaxID=2305907 RepID=A0A396RSJ3_9SPHN|nr:AMP-binding protein [Sphingomonas gilva]RHW17313.1 AMP-binding protein [Sphingomonas gilva]
MTPLDPTPRPLDHIALLGARRGAALIDKAGALDHAGLERETGRLAAWLAGQGLAKGARVATWLPKTRTACLMPIAAARAGLVHVPVNPALKRAQVAHILADSGAELLVTAQARAATLEDGDLASARPAFEDAIDPPETGLPPSSADTDDLVAILYTSGSTGQPKGVMLSHANLWLGAISVAHYLKLAADDRVLGVMPLSFDYGQNQLFSTWAAGAAYIPLDYLTPRDVAKAIVRHDITTLAGVPPLWMQLADTEWPPHRLRRITNTGGALTPGLVRKLRALMPDTDIYAMYGLTEAFRSTYLDPALIDAHPDSIGGAIPFAEVMVVGPDGAEAEQGELVHAGPLVAQGYWRDPERTAKRFRPAPVWSKSGGMAAWSGDTVRRGPDGWLRFVGRDDEMIKSAGNRMSPNEIEEAVMAGGEAREAAAFGIPDERLGQAVVVALAGDPAREDNLRARLRRDLPAFMQPQRYVWRESLPRNANGKLDRTAIKAEIAP